MMGLDWLAGDFGFYFTFADNFFRGLIPYRDYYLDHFPGALIIFLLPRVFTSNYDHYILFFAFLMGLLFSLQLFLLIQKWRERKQKRVWFVFLILSASLILPLFLIRFDLVPTLFAFLALSYFFKKRRFFLGEGFLALGTVVKFFAVVLLPVFTIYFLKNKETIRALKGVFFYLLFIGLFTVPFLLSGGLKGLLNVFLYHLNRPVEIESLPASLLFLGSFWEEAKVFYEFGSENISLPAWDKPVLRLFSLFWLGGLILVYLWFLRKKLTSGASTGEQEFIILKVVTLTILVFIAFNKVFSPQYLIWLWPFAFWLFLYLPPKQLVILGSLLCLVFFLTLVNLVKFWDLVAFSKSAIFTQVLRNILFLVFLLGISLAKGKGKSLSN